MEKDGLSFELNAKFVYVGIRVKDLEESALFYTKVLGMKVKYRFQIDLTKGRGVCLASPDGAFNLELNYYADSSAYGTPYVVGEGLDHLAFSVDDLAKALEEAKSAGYNPILSLEAGKFRWTYIQDPNGIWIELFGRSDEEWLLEHKEDIVM